MKPRSVSCNAVLLEADVLDVRRATGGDEHVFDFQVLLRARHSTVNVTEFLPTLTFEILAPVSTVIPRFLKDRAEFHANVGVFERQSCFGITSTSVTCVPNALNTSANSQPTAPAPTMAIVFGAFSRISASSDEMTVVLFSSRPTCGRPFTREPVADARWPSSHRASPPSRRQS